MPQNKNQHYVPKCYIKRFSNISKESTIFLIEKNTYVRKVNYKNQCKSDFYYGKDMVWEKKLSKMETKWGKVFDRITLNETYIPSEKDSILLKEFAVIQKSRSKANNSHSEELDNQTSEIIYQIDFNNFGMNNIAKYLSVKNRRKLAVEYFKNSHYIYVKRNLENAYKNKNLLEDLNVLVISFKTQNKLIISDDPIIMINRFTEHNIGLIMMGLVVFFPISPETLVVIYDSKMYPKYSKINRKGSRNEEEVDFLNAFQYISG
jgi:hypothetical protein